MCVRKQPASAAMLYNYARVQLSRDSRDGTSESCSWAQESLSSNNLRFHNEVCRVAGVLGHLGCGPGCWCCGRHAHGTLLGITDDVNPDVNPDVNMRPSRTNLDRAALVSAPSKHTQPFKSLLSNISSSNILDFQISPVLQGNFAVLIAVS